MTHREDSWQLRTYAKLPVSPIRGEGPWVFDAEGRRFLDFYGGHAVASTGHCHPEVVEAIRRQAGQLLFYSNAIPSEPRAEASERLVKWGYKNLTKVFLTNSGAEANEAALKMARKHTGREEVIFTEGSFHGRTMACLSVCGIAKYRSFRPELPSTRQVPFGDLEAMKSAISSSTAAVILEPLQSLAGIRLADPAYYQSIRRICDAHGVVLIFDEVQSAPARTGRNMIGHHWDVEPDLCTSAKGVGSGLPIGVTWVHTKIAERIPLGEHGSTFGGGPVVCAAVAATLRVLESAQAAKTADRQSLRIRDGVKSIGGLWKGVRGLGLLLGLETEGPASPVRDKLLAKGLITGDSFDPSVIRLMPPLLLEDQHVDAMLEILASVR
ncbi:MAG: aspartate aminotransferase family protein [Planctomycetota bacterium]